MREQQNERVNVDDLKNAYAANCLASPSIDRRCRQTRMDVQTSIWRRSASTVARVVELLSVPSITRRLIDPILAPKKGRRLCPRRVICCAPSRKATSPLLLGSSLLCSVCFTSLQLVSYLVAAPIAVGEFRVPQARENPGLDAEPSSLLDRFGASLKEPPQ